MGLGLGLGLGLGFGAGFSGIYSGNGDHHLAMQVLVLKSQCMVHILSTYSRTLNCFFYFLFPQQLAQQRHGAPAAAAAAAAAAAGGGGQWGGAFLPHGFQAAEPLVYTHTHTLNTLNTQHTHTLNNN